MRPPIFTTDTSREAFEIQLDAMRRLTPAERIRKMLDMSACVKKMAMDAIRRRHPEFGENEVRLKFIEITYGADLASKVRADQKERGLA